MQTEFPTAEGLQGASALLGHLRNNPQDARRSPRELAAQFGLGENFVRTMLEAVDIPSNEPVVTKEKRSALPLIRRLAAKAGGVFEGMADKPLLPLGISSLLGCMLALGGLLLSHATKGASHYAFAWAGLVAVSLSLIFQMTLLYRKGMGRYACWGGLFFGLSGAATMLTDEFIWPTKGSPLPSAQLKFMIVILMIVLGFMYAGVGAVVSVLGGWNAVKRRDREQAHMNRQASLQYYFDLQRRLQEATDTGQPLERPIRPIVASMRRQPFWWLFIISLTSTAATNLGAMAYHIDLTKVKPGSILPIPYMFMAMFFSVGVILMFALLTYLSGSIWRAIVTSLGYSAAGIIGLFIPGSPRYKVLLDHSNRLDIGVGMAINLLMFAGFAAIAGLGAMLQQRIGRDKRLQQNDPATLLAEMLQVQWRLSHGSTTISVLVIDAAKSAEMKATADPLVVEYSFRAYQTWIEKHSSAYQGRIIAGTGDGAIMAFADSPTALKAARDMLADLERFNRDENRLAQTFRVRFALHCGKVVAEVDKVQFTQVIDIAAHLEKLAPIGGIAVTDSAADELTGENLIPVAHEVDGHRVFTVPATI